MMVVVTISCCPPKLRGDLTKWLIEIDTGVYVGNLNARIRDAVWDRICENIKNGRASMAYSTNNEQKLDFRIHNTDWEPVDYDGIKLVRHNINNNSDNEKYRQTSKANIQHINSLSQKKKKSFEQTENYVAIDIETTGLADDDEIIEIGALRIENGQPVDSYSSLVKCRKTLPKEITELTGITQEEINERGVPVEKAIEDFLNFCGNDELLGHNISFDLKFLLNICRKTGHVINNKTTDTMRIARKKLDIRSYTLKSVAENLGIEYGRLHRVSDDCMLTYRIFEKLKEK